LGPWATANYCRAGIKSLRGTPFKLKRELFYMYLLMSIPWQVHYQSSFLGVLFDNDLNFKIHVKSIMTKISKGIFA
jgi:hypothetical protein